MKKLLYTSLIATGLFLGAGMASQTKATGGSHPTFTPGMNINVGNTLKLPKISKPGHKKEKKKDKKENSKGKGKMQYKLY